VGKCKRRIGQSSYFPRPPFCRRFLSASQRYHSTASHTAISRNIRRRPPSADILDLGTRECQGEVSGGPRPGLSLACCGVFCWEPPLAGSRSRCGDWRGNTVPSLHVFVAYVAAFIRCAIRCLDSAWTAGRHGFSPEGSLGRPTGCTPRSQSTPQAYPKRQGIFMPGRCWRRQDQDRTLQPLYRRSRSRPFGRWRTVHVETNHSPAQTEIPSSVSTTAVSAEHC